MIDIGKVKYPEMERILLLQPNPHILLGKEIFWQEKRDGSNLGVYLDENGDLQLRSRNMPKASEDFYKAFMETAEWGGVLELLQDAATWKDEYVIFGELLLKGKSPTRTEYHEKNEFVLFDIWSSKQGGFMSYIQAYQHGYHFELPFVELYGTCNVTSLESLLAFKDRMLERCQETKREGVVGKVWDFTPFNTGEGAGLKRGIIYFKEKLDTPHIEKVPRATDEGTIILPPLPESEIMGAVEKVLADIGMEKFRQIREAMPLVARYVNEECKKHNCTAPRNLHHYYQRRLADLLEASP